MSGAGAETQGAVELSFTFTEEEYTSAARAFYARTPHASFNFYIVATVVLASLLFAALAGDPYLGGMLFMVGLVGVAWRYHAEYAAPRAQFRRNPKFADEYRLTFTEEGVFFRGKGIESRAEWAYYSRVWETPECYFLVYGEDMFSLVPKRAFRGPRQEAAFRDLLRRKLGLAPGASHQTRLEQGAPAEEYVPPAEPPDWR
jgi:hypothetical protein